MTISSTEAISGPRALVDRALQGRAIGVVGRSARALVFRADFRARARDAARKRHDDVADRAHRLDRRLRRREGLRRARAHDDEIAAADRALGEIGSRFADELSVHHRHAPVAAGPEPLGDLPAVAEKADRRAELELVLARLESGVTGRARAGQHALPDAVLQLSLQLRGRDREHEHAHAWPSVQRLSRRHDPLEARLAAAPDHRGGEAGHRRRRLRGPARGRRRDDKGGRAHVESFGECVVDGDAVDGQRAHATASNGCGRPTAPSGTRMKSDGRP